MDENLSVWNEIFHKANWGKYPPLGLIRFAAKNFGACKNKQDIKILEIGAGPGANLWFLAREGFAVYGIDGSPRAKELCEKRLQEEGLTSQLKEYVVGNFIELPFPDGYFDAIIDVEALSCNPFNATKEILYNCHRKLKPDGLFYSMTFSEQSWGYEPSIEVSYHAGHPKEGILSNQGLIRFTTKEDVSLLYPPDQWKLSNLELYTRQWDR